MEVDPRPNPGAAPSRRRNSAAGAGEAHAADALPRCPNCGWQDVRPSHTRSTLGMALALFSIAPFRCRSCSHRFYRFSRKDREL